MNTFMQEVLAYIHQNYQTVTVNELCKKFGYTQSHFSRIFVAYNGVSAVEYIASAKVFYSFKNMDAHKSVLKAHLDVGYLSTGTFTNNFKRKTGLSPKKYQLQVPNLFAFIKKAEIDEQNTYEYSLTNTSTKNNLEVNIQLPRAFEGLCFVGLFKRMIPNHTPVLGKVLKKSKTIVFDNIPDGRFFLMSCGIPKTNNPLNYFFLKDEYRAFINQPFIFEHNKSYKTTLTLRKKVPTDPPLTINLPHLLYSQLRKQK
ncbi:helix-turn-helix domain-containing protein [Culicoidibacter larvae]|uniref:Helix-turn-helix domain-containing protein n=1 Tax=Culicoidibacter larvae TaxID=2579976 RepID=A0A5R8QGA7_9FIRM|nr:helix-turn-helix domain-containing protein [Culicoidibacter larvae]TLG76740.1 helix-turn-helix domain-containing protein [Culicoidibacter larvae]